MHITDHICEYQSFEGQLTATLRYRSVFTP
jgi:hypothetical protein